MVANTRGASKTKDKQASLLDKIHILFCFFSCFGKVRILVTCGLYFIEDIRDLIGLSNQTGP